MGKGNRKRKHRKQSQRKGEERHLLKEREMERVEREDAERRAKHSTKTLAARAGSDPPILGEPDAPVRAPLRQPNIGRVYVDSVEIASSTKACGIGLRCLGGKLASRASGETCFLSVIP